MAVLHDGEEKKYSTSTTSPRVVVSIDGASVLRSSLSCYVICEDVSSMYRIERLHSIHTCSQASMDDSCSFEVAGNQ